MKKPIALLVNDLHISKDNINEFEKNWYEILAICKTKDIEDVVIGGDVFTSRASQTLATLLAVKQAFDKASAHGIYVTIAEGNHDKVDLESIDGYNHLWRGLPNIEVIDNYKVMSWSGCGFVLIVFSYFPEDGSFLEKLESATQYAIAQFAPPVSSESDIVLYIHEGVHGSLGDFEIEGELPQEPLLKYKAVLCGHYHNRTKIKNTNIEYIGSSRQHNFGEDEDKGYTILYTDGSYEFVKNEVNTRYKTISVNMDELPNYALDKDDRYKYKVKVHCSETQLNKFDKQLVMAMGFDKVEVVSKETMVASDSSEITEKYDKQGIKKEYLNYCNDKNIDSSLGLKYLEN